MDFPFACAAMIAVGESGVFNPFVIVIVLGPWLAGAVLRERQQVARRLQDVGRELESESQLLAEEAVRLHGPIRGPYLALRRLLRCHPWAVGGPDPVPKGLH